MKRLDIPANLTIMALSAPRLSPLKPVRVLDIFDGGPEKFHADGLFSTTIFGRVGSEERDRRFSYIDIKATVFHPLIFHTLVALRGLYGGIMQGKAYALWNEKEKDFDPSDEVNGQTGYAFFFKYWNSIIFKRTESPKRDARIALIEKYKPVAITNKVLVIPAGLRDLQVDADGRTREGELNEFYRSMISTANSIGTTTDMNSTIMNNSRYSLQMAFNKVFDFIIDSVSGKGGFLQGKWGSRNLIYGTRNVITSMDTSVPVLGAPNSPKQNNTVLGLFQCMKNSLPLAKHGLLQGIVGQAFQTNDGVAYVVDPVTLEKKQVRVPTEIRDKWATNAGLESLINSYREPRMRAKPVMIGEDYLGLIYRPKDRLVYKIFNDIKELPEGLLKSDVYPLTYCELFYLSTGPYINDLAMFTTRYPVAGVGSSPPSIPYIKNTVRSEMRKNLTLNWEDGGEECFLAVEFPILDGEPVFFDTMSIHPSRLAAAAADQL